MLGVLCKTLESVQKVDVFCSLCSLMVLLKVSLCWSPHRFSLRVAMLGRTRTVSGRCRFELQQPRHSCFSSAPPPTELPRLHYPAGIESRKYKMGQEAQMINSILKVIKIYKSRCQSNNSVGYTFLPFLFLGQRIWPHPAQRPRLPWRSGFPQQHAAIQPSRRGPPEQRHLPAGPWGRHVRRV